MDLSLKSSVCIRIECVHKTRLRPLQQALVGEVLKAKSQVPPKGQALSHCPPPSSQWVSLSFFRGDYVVGS